MKSLTFITGNASKAAQLGQYLQLPFTHTKLDIPEIQSLDLEAVATAKARAAFGMLGSAVLVEDTALTFDTLNCLPGPLVKWFLESLGNDGLASLLQGQSNRRALAETCFALCDEIGVHIFRSARRGTIAETSRGTAGFGWDPLFIPEGCSLTWAEMSTEQQEATSLRKDAILQLRTYLEVHYQ
jgi:non-canonical purine NTP pyrophosphatase (RdgB/HAM1 family)